MFYCDTSLLVGAFTPEPRSTELRRWLSERQAALTISGWVTTEFAGAIALKGRRGYLDKTGQEAALLAWRKFASAIAVAPIEARHFDLATELLRAPDFVLKSGDALHLAIARD